MMRAQTTCISVQTIERLTYVNETGLAREWGPTNPVMTLAAGSVRKDVATGFCFARDAAPSRAGRNALLQEILPGSRCPAG